MEEARKMEIVVNSAEQLKFHTSGFLKQKTFVIVRIDSRSFGRTNFDRNGGSFPSWNETLQLTLPPATRSLPVEVYCKTAFGVKMVGKAKIPVSDFIGGLTPAKYLHFLSYRLRDKKGNKNGIINISVRMDGRESVSDPTLYQIPQGRIARSDFPVRMEAAGSVCRPSLNRIPAGTIAGFGLPVREERIGGLVIGIPVSHGFPV